MAYDDPNHDPMRERPFQGIGKILLGLCVLFSVYLGYVNFKSGTIRDGATQIANRLDVRKQVGEFIDELTSTFKTATRSKHPFGRDYPKGTKRIAPLFTVSVPDFANRKPATWVTSIRKGKRTTEFRYWGWHTRNGPQFTIAFRLTNKTWSRMSISKSIMRTNAVGSNGLDLSGFPETVATNNGEFEILEFTANMKAGTKNCIGFQHIRERRKVRINGAACAAGDKIVDRKALACIISSAKHPNVPIQANVHDDTPCTRLFVDPANAT